MKDALQLLMAFVLGLAVGAGSMYFVIGGNAPRTVNHKIEIEKPHWWPGK